MRITTEPLENRQLALTIELDEERTQQAMQRAAREIAKQVDIPGFRRGKAPYAAIVQRFGEEVVRRQAADLIADDVYAEALEQEQIKPYAAALDDLKLNPITFRLTVQLIPEVDLGNYRELRLEPPSVAVPPEDVAQVLESIREEEAFFEPADRPAKIGDGVEFSLVARTADGAEVLRGNDLRTILAAGSDDPAPGFHEALVGATAGEERVFTLTLGENFPQEERRGQEATFTVTVNQVYDYILPQLDDDLARAVGHYASLDELRQDVERRMLEGAKQRADEQYGEQVIAALVERARIEYPPALLREQLDHMVQEYGRAVTRETKLSLEDYLRVRNKTEEQLREEMTPRAVQRVKVALALSELARREGLDVSEEELKRGLEEMIAPFGSRAEQMRAALTSSEEGRRSVVSRLLTNKAVERLVAIARGEAPPLPSETTDAQAAPVEAEATAAGAALAEAGG